MASKIVLLHRKGYKHDFSECHASIMKMLMSDNCKLGDKMVSVVHGVGRFDLSKML